MLTRRLTGVLIAAVSLVAGLMASVVQISPAAADDCIQEVETSPGVWEYVNTCTGDDGEGGGDEGGGDEGGGDDGGSTEPECYLGREDQFDYDWSYCTEDGLSCYVYAPPPTAPDPEDWPEKPAGMSENAVYSVLTCFTQPPEEDVVIYGPPEWIEPPEDVINWEQEAVQAFGQLVAPDFDLAFNPPAKSYVTLDTWYWAEGATDGELEGTSAAGLVAIATPERLEVQPGDGSATLTCPFSVTQSDACTYVYEKASVDGTATVDGEPAYAGPARLVYTVRFEFNGEVMEIASAPTVFETPWDGTPIPVAEIQAIVEDE